MSEIALPEIGSEAAARNIDDANSTLANERRYLFGLGPTRVLSVSGGGYRGLFAARVLVRLEEHLARLGYSAAVDPEGRSVLQQHFRLFVGTSAGALLAAAAAVGIPSDAIADGFRRVAPNVFKKKRGSAAQLSLFGENILDLVGIDLRPFKQPPYNLDDLRDAIRSILGAEQAQRSMKDIETPLAIVAVNFNHARPVVFRSAGIDPTTAADIPLEEALLASAAAPTYFRPHNIAYRDSIETFIDGGLVANAPDIIGISDAIGRLFADPVETHMLSIGTATPSQSGGPVAPKKSDGLSWLRKHKLIAKIISSQEVLAQELSRTLLSDRYQRIDLVPDRHFEPHIEEIDETLPESTAALLMLADRAWDEAAPRLQEIGLLR